MNRSIRTPRRARAGAALATVSLLVVSACGGASSDKDASGTTGGAEAQQSLGLTADAGESGLAKAGEPRRGGTLVYGIEAESSAGYCLSSSQLAIGGITVARAFYDTLMVPNADGGYSPYLAESLTSNDNQTVWTVKLRPDIKFHDGSALDATVVKNNIDAYRGKYPGRPSLLFTFILQDIAEVNAVDALTVEITTSRPWVSMPAVLYASARLGIMAQAQLDAPEDGCATNPIGTGPFRFVSWTKNQKLVGERNPDYWQIAPDGEPYPYVDTIEFRPIPDGTVRINSLESGSIDVLHIDEAERIKNSLRDLRDAGKINMFVSGDEAEVNFMQLNSSIPPFNDVRMRRALAHATNRADNNRRLNASLPEVASGPFGPGSMGFLEDAGFPAYDPAEAKRLIDEYRADTGDDGGFTITCSTNPATIKGAEQIQRQAQAVGLDVKVQTIDQAGLIDRAIAGSFEAMAFRNFPGGDPDQNYVWWYGGGNPVNFGKWDNPELNELLDAGRETNDPAKRKEIYQDVNRIMATEVYGLWTTYAVWAVATDANVHGILGPPLPGDDPSQPGDASTDDPTRQPARGLAVSHPLLGLWVSENSG
ncbi:MAG: ABC transporter substrate-binding protein [Microthrixaceae bacterium]|jgi:peptide/nickel transport system substrate-binding protein|nr:ABC transporter substrate-binding protein [Microthrixaceae bacterium]